MITSWPCLLHSYISVEKGCKSTLYPWHCLKTALVSAVSYLTSAIREVRSWTAVVTECAFTSPCACWDQISFLWSCHNSATGCKIVKTGTVYLYGISILAETLSLHHCILLIYYNRTWKCEMMYHIRPSVSLGFPSTMSSLLMLTGRTYTNKCTLVNKFSKNWVSWRLLLVRKLF